MALANYTDLKAAVALWIVRPDLTALIPDFITLYEADANRRIRIRQNMVTATVTLSQGNAIATLPAGFLEEVELNYDDTAEPLSRAEFDMLDRMQTADSLPARPHLYAITSSGTQSFASFETESDATYTLNLRYYQKWSIATDITNWLLLNAPDAYLFGAVAEAAMYLHDPNLLQIAVGRRDAATEWVLRSDSRTKANRLTVDPALVGRSTFDWRV